MQFQVGDRVLMIRHADWKADAVGTISGGPRQRVSSHGQTYWDYIIDFDEPQSDFTDQMHGEVDRTYRRSTVAAEFIRPLNSNVQGDAATPHVWTGIDQFYQQLIESGWRLQPLRELASFLGSSRWANSVYPSTSHEALGLSTADNFSVRLTRPMIYVEYNEPDGEFVIHYQEHQGKDVFAETEPVAISSVTLDKMMRWLGVFEHHV